MWGFKRELYKTPQSKEDIVIIEDIDYLVFTYGFSDGRDLDTCTQLLTPIQEAKLGYSHSVVNNSTNIYTVWGGDNTGLGVETVLIDVKKLKTDFPDRDVIEFCCGAIWYAQRVSGNVTMIVNAYRGGTMSIQNYDFINTGGVLVKTFDFNEVNVSLVRATTYPLPSETVGLFRYTKSTGTLERCGCDCTSYGGYGDYSLASPDGLGNLL